MQFGQAAEEVVARVLDACIELFRAQVGITEQERFAQLAAQRILDADERLADEILRVRARGRLVAEVAREHNATQVVNDVDDRLLAREMAIGVGEEDLRGFIVFGHRLDDAVQIFVEHAGLSGRAPGAVILSWWNHAGARGALRRCVFA